MRLLVLPALLLPVGCIEAVLWPDQRPVKQLASAERAHFVVEAAAIDPTPVGTEEPLVSLLLRARHRRGRWVPMVADQLGATTWFALQLPADDADALLQLLTAEPLGRTDHCAIDVEWTRSPEGYEFWEGRVGLRGSLSSDLRATELTAAAAAALRQSSLILPAADIPDRLLREQAELAAAVDPRLLFRFADADALQVVCLWPAQATGDEVEPRLLLTCGAGPTARQLLLQPALAPLLAKVQRERDTLAGGFVFGCAGAARPVRAPDLAMIEVVCPATLMLRTRIEVLQPRHSALERLVLQPIVRFVDASLQFVFELLFPEFFRPDPPPTAPRIPGRK